MIFDVELHCDKWKECSCRWSNLDGGFWCNEEGKREKSGTAVERVLATDEAVYILYGNGMWRRKEKR